MIKLLILMGLTIVAFILWSVTYLHDHDIVCIVFDIILDALLWLICIRVIYLVYINFPSISNGIKWLANWLFS